MFLKLGFIWRVTKVIKLFWLLGLIAGQMPNSSLAASSEPFRPLVFIPGILGVELLDQNNNIIWGDRGSLVKFEQLELAEGRASLRPGGLVKAINVLGPLWSIHQYDGLLQQLENIGYKEGKNLFILYYDWRQSNFNSANQLKTLIEGNAALKGHDIDILAHSMGGLIGRIYIQENEDKVHVKRLISLAVPSRGSMNALAETTDGWGGFENFLAGGITTIRRVMISFPSLTELFPSYDCCRWGKVGDRPDRSKVFDPTDIALWTSGDWLPVEYRSGSGLARFSNSLADARKLRTLLGKSLPTNIEQIIIAGDKFDTNLYLYVDPQNKSWKNWQFSKNVGDGTVPLWSASASDWPGRSLPAFTDHATIFEDEWVKDFLKRILNKNSGPPLIANKATALAQTNLNRLVELSLLSLTFDKSVVAVGDTVNVFLTISTVDPVDRNDFTPVIVLKGPGGDVKLPLIDKTSDSELSARTLRYSGQVTIKQSGAYSAFVTLPGLGGGYTRDFIALDKNQ